jgi:hypothetical protein
VLAIILVVSLVVAALKGLFFLALIALFSSGCSGWAASCGGPAVVQRG